MLVGWKYNFPSDVSYTRDLWQCPHGCEMIDSQEHTINKCKAYNHIKENLDLSDDKDLVEFFKKVIDIRQKLTQP